MHQDCERILITADQIRERVLALGEQITKDYHGEEVIFVSILNGSYIFTADLMRAVELPCQVDFMQVSSYGDSTCSSGTLKIKRDLNSDITGKHIIIVEDILDTGYTMRNLINYLGSKNPRSMKICTMIDKPARRTEEVSADYLGFVINEDLFLVGYGLDYAQRYRNLPYVAILKPEIYS
ncbi:MAG: hypoxanthine phosphoribosyltransferase [Ruminococcaceae bacterium]|nr:hypoxanthine phosphoribosyltransferase [Oscillospiraceae bacterium]